MFAFKTGDYIMRLTVTLIAVAVLLASCGII